MAQDNTIPHGKPGIASFESESWGNAGEPRFGDGPARTVTRTVTAGADLDLPIYSVVSLIAGVLALAVLGAAAGSATGTVTFSVAVPAANDTVTVNGRVYTFKATVAATADEVLIGADLAATAVNLAAAINATAASAGTLFGSATTINTDVRATVSGAVVTVIALNAGDEGNAITLAEASTNIAVSGATLTGGDDDIDIKPYGILASPMVLANGESMSVPIYVDGHWNMDALNWDASWQTDEAKRAAFEGSLNPGILVSKPNFSDGSIAV
jgi:hypothetical protein